LKQVMNSDARTAVNVPHSRRPTPPRLDRRMLAPASIS
jgi:hypothetical protein